MVEDGEQELESAQDAEANGVRPENALERLVQFVRLLARVQVVEAVVEAREADDIKRRAAEPHQHVDPPWLAVKRELGVPRVPELGWGVARVSDGRHVHEGRLTSIDLSTKISVSSRI